MQGEIKNNFPLLHRLYHSFYKGDFIIGQFVFFILKTDSNSQLLRVQAF